MYLPTFCWYKSTIKFLAITIATFPTTLQVNTQTVDIQSHLLRRYDWTQKIYQKKLGVQTGTHQVFGCTQQLEANFHHCLGWTSLPSIGDVWGVQAPILTSISQAGWVLVIVSRVRFFADACWFWMVLFFFVKHKHALAIEHMWCKMWVLKICIAFVNLMSSTPELWRRVIIYFLEVQVND